MKILYISSEITPFAKTGGLADVAQALPKAIKALGHDIRTVMPKYLSVAEQSLAREQVTPFTVQMHNGLQGAVLWQAEIDFVPTYFIENRGAGSCSGRRNCGAGPGTAVGCGDPGRA